MHNWMPYEAKRSRLGNAGRLVWWPSALMRMADRCCECPTSLLNISVLYVGHTALNGLAWGLFWRGR